MTRLHVKVSWVVTAFSVALCAADARAFTHVVKRGETLADLAERFYGRVQHEQLLVAANALQASGGVPIVAGQRLHVPAVSHRRIQPGDTWGALAEELLGAERRADVLAAANGTSPWKPPEQGVEIVIPYNLRIIATGNETIVGLAYKYLGDRKKAWTLNRYNQLGGRHLQRGDVVLIPLVDLPLTEAGNQAAAQAAGITCGECAGAARQAQLQVDAELPALMADVRGGRYVSAITRANRFLASGALARAQRAVVHRQLLEAYAALDAPGLAAESCKKWRDNDPQARLDPVRMSPKLLAACKRAGQ